MNRLLILGYGFTGRALVRRLNGWSIAATSRSPETRATMAAEGLKPLDPSNQDELRNVLQEADAILIAAPPDQDGCPGLRSLVPAWPQLGPGWIGYLSTTGMYGDRGGGWVSEDTSPNPISAEALRRAAAEFAWARVAENQGTGFAIFRLPGIYGPGRSALDRVRTGGAKRWISPGHVFSRVHVDDLAGGLALAIEARANGVFNICDDEPAASSDVITFAARLLQAPAPPEAPLDLAALSPMARRFWAESRRVSNARAKSALGWRPIYPTYREGLRAVLAAEAASAGDGHPHLAG